MAGVKGLKQHSYQNVLPKSTVWAEAYIFVLLFFCMTVLLSYAGNYIGRLQAAVTLKIQHFLVWI